MTKVALITGGARRVGAAIVKKMHNLGVNVVVHCHRSLAEGKALVALLNQQRQDSAYWLQADLNDIAALAGHLSAAQAQWGRLDVLINNASSFYPTRLGETTEFMWDDLMNTNVKAPYFLSQSAAPWLRQTQGIIINITDARHERGYCATIVFIA